MTTNPIDAVFPNGTTVNKSSVRQWGADRLAQRLEDADELRAMDTAGTKLFIIDNVLWAFDPSDTTSPDDGNLVLVSNDGDRYDRVIQELPYLSLIPQGRITLTSATPVLTSGVSGAGTVYYALYTGNLVPVTTNGTGFKPRPFTQLSNVLADSSTGKAGPAAAANNSNYDLFIWDDNGTLRLTRGPAWTSDTGRGTGAGTTELTRVAGLFLNAVAITNGPPQNRGTYVGTIRTNGSAQVDVAFGATAASGGSAGTLGLWNAFNRVPVAAYALESADTWTYATGSFRPYNNSTGNRVSLIRGLDEAAVAADFTGVVSVSSGTISPGVAIGLDSTSAATGIYRREVGLTIANARTAQFRGPVGLGYHFLQALEYGGTNATFYGDGGATLQTGLSLFTDW